ncbi:MAG: hypothetical protein GC150_03525 [Rhizobiales bacterium]|nr:hypothetical protein [Hyphomicrobiales bacterium]
MLALALAGLLAVCLGLGRPAVAEGPTVEEYLAHVGEEASVIAYGQVRIDGKRMICGRRPTVIDPTLDDYAAAYPTFLILNPKRMEGLPTAVKLWIFSHECGHQFRGPDEERADCFAVQRGRRQGWLDETGLAQICSFIKPSAGSSMHWSGPKRCEIMRACFADPTIH